MTTSKLCKSIGCCNPITHQPNMDFCTSCLNKDGSDNDLSLRYPGQYKTVVGDETKIDIFAINQMFRIQDSSGCLQHTIRKLLTAGEGTLFHNDIREARDTLTRWLQLNQAVSIGTNESN